MRTRVVVVGGAVVVVVALVVGLAVWVTRGNDDVPLASTDASSERAEPTPGPPDAAALPAGPVGRAVASCAPVVLEGRITERYWGMHSSSPLGSDFPDAPVGSVNLTTAQVYWNQIETAPGQYDFARLDQIVDTSADRGARAMLVMGFTPSFHSADPSSPTAAATMPDEEAWRSWVSTVVERYGDAIDYQIWPEPNIVSNWEGTPAQMARLSVIAARLVHERAPRALVVAPATTLRLRSQQQWMDRYWGADVGDTSASEVLDAVALDPFPFEDGTPEDSSELVCRARDILAKHGVDLPVWTNEINYGVPSGGPSTGAAPYSDERQAAVVARTYLLHAALGIDRVYWLGWFSYPGLSVEMVRDGVVTPAGLAFREIHQWLASGTIPACAVTAGTYECRVRRGGSRATVLWREQGTEVRRLEGAAVLRTLDGGSRRVDAGERLRIGQSPVAMVARG